MVKLIEGMGDPVPDGVNPLTMLDVALHWNEVFTIVETIAI